MLTKQEIIERINVESEITKRVIAAFPEGKLDYTPHEKSTPAGKLMRVFAVDVALSASTVKGEIKEDPYEGVEEVNSVPQAVELLTTHVNKLVEAINSVSQEDLDSNLEMWGMTKPRADFVMMFLADMIHHRGQMSVYIRLAGGLVPAIYGPSADDKGEM